MRTRACWFFPFKIDLMFGACQMWIRVQATNNSNIIRWHNGSICWILVSITNEKELYSDAKLKKSGKQGKLNFTLGSAYFILARAIFFQFFFLFISS